MARMNGSGLDIPDLNHLFYRMEGFYGPPAPQDELLLQMSFFRQYLKAFQSLPEDLSVPA